MPSSPVTTLCTLLEQSDQSNQAAAWFALFDVLSPEHITLGIFTELIEALAQYQVPNNSTELKKRLLEANIHCLDCCGTGGSGLNPFNTSTTVAFILSSAGIPVVKFGNRAQSSQSGSFDFLSALGIPDTLPTDQLADLSFGLLQQSLPVFWCAPQFYPKLKPLSQYRKLFAQQTGQASVFNFLGPLLHPLKPSYRLLGVSHPRMQALISDYLQSYLATTETVGKSWVVRGENGLDELLFPGESQILEVIPGQSIQEKKIIRKETAESIVPLALPTGSSCENAAVFEAFLKGDGVDTALHSQVCLNAGAGLWLTGKAASLEDGEREAAQLLSSGAVAQTYERTRKAYAPYLG